MRTLTLFDLWNKYKFYTFSEVCPGITERKIQRRVNFLIEHIRDLHDLHIVKEKYPEIYKMTISFLNVINDITIDEDVFTTEVLFDRIRRLQENLSDHDVIFYSLLYLIEKERKGEVLIYKDESLSLESLLILDTPEKGKLLYKFLHKKIPIYIQRTPKTPYIKKLIATIFPGDKTKNIKDLITAIYTFILNLPEYTRQTSHKSEHAKALIDIFLYNNPYLAVSKLLPEKFGLNPESVSDEEYKIFEGKLIKEFKELKYNIEGLKTYLKHQFIESFGANDIKEIKERLGRIKDIDEKIFAIYNALEQEQENWIELSAIVIQDKAITDFTDNDVELFPIKLKRFIAFIEETEKQFIERLETDELLPFYINVKTPSENISIFEFLNKNENSDIPAELNLSIKKLNKRQKITLIQHIINSLTEA